MEDFITATNKDGDEVEVQLPEGWVKKDELGDDFVPDGYVSEAVLEDRVERVESQLKGKLSAELMDNDDFVQRVVKVRKDDVYEMLGVDPDQPEIDPEKFREQVRQDEVQPLNEKIEEFQTEIEELRGDRLTSQVMSASNEFGIKPDMADLVSLYYQNITEYDPKYRDFFVKDSDGDYIPNPKAKKGEAPYLTVSAHLAQLKKEGKRPSWFQAKQRDGAGFEGAEPEAPEDLRSEISRLEAAGKYGEAGRLKTKLLASYRK